MSFVTIFNSAVRFLPATMCVLVTLVVGSDTAKAQEWQVSCHDIGVLGAVKMPGRFEFQARTRLVEVLKRAGGPTGRAGKVVSVIHTCSCLPCADGEAKPFVKTEYNLSAAIEGKEHANPDVVPGDIVIVPETESVFVIAHGSSASLAYREGVTLTQAIAPVVRAARLSDQMRVRIQRDPLAGPRPEPFILSLKAVLDHQSEDPVLEPRDIIEISDEAGNFRSRLPPTIFRDSPLIYPSGKPPLVHRRSSNS